MSYQPKNEVPTDADVSRAWQKIATLARDNALVISAYGGVMLLAMPEEQRRQGLRAKALRAGLFQLEEGHCCDAPLPKRFGAGSTCENCGVSFCRCSHPPHSGQCKALDGCWCDTDFFKESKR